MKPDLPNRPREVAAEEVDWVADVSGFGFDTTEHLEPLDHIVGQPRAVRALEFGLGVRHPGYNIYVAGASGTGKKELIRSALAERVDREATPSDWVYVNNFDEADRPLAVSLEPGQGIRLKDDLTELVARLLEDLPRAFQDEELAREKERMGEKYQERDGRMLKELDEAAGEHRINVRLTPSGFIMFPLKEGEPISKEDVEQLSEEEQQELEERQEA
ncbi:MAG: AAA family ATPase, partial [Akkermansiaceae bacterium]|nr:AAA family ATPase [Akkermansiaceae bacterium]